MPWTCMQCGIDGLGGYTGEPPMCLRCGGMLEEYEEEEDERV